MAILEVVALAALAVAIGAGYFWRDVRLRRRCLERLGVRTRTPVDTQRLAPFRIERFPRRHRVLPGSAAVAACLLLYFWLGLPLLLAAAFGAMLAVLGYLLEGIAAGRKSIEMEAQFADAIDVIVGSLRAGSTLIAALDAAIREARDPLRPYLVEMVARIRLGANPEGAVRELADQVPLESFRLFTLTLGAQWWSGGSMAATLSRVGRTARDRLEMKRRIRTQRAEAELSVAGVLVLSYILAIILWRANPEPMVQFLRSSVGMQLAAFAIALQALGIAWISKLSRIDF
jgi:tight adherence protein B